MKRIYKTKLEDVETLAKEIASKLKGGEILGLIGDLGAGKTTFTQLLAKQLGVSHRVTSPTFILMQSYPGKLLTKQKITLHHLDVYRLDNHIDIANLGLTDFWHRPDSITVIEWADKIKKQLPKHTIYIYFKS